MDHHPHHHHHHHHDPALSQDGHLTRSIAAHVVPASPAISVTVIVIVGYLGMVATLVGVGEAIVHGGAFAGLRGWDDDVTRWMADHRTPFFDGLTGVLSQAADTFGVIAIAVVVEIVVVVQRRWSALLIVPIGLVLELLTFLTVNAIVGRPRPTVPKLGSEPSTTSYPSGHTAATIVLWGAVVVLFCSAAAAHRRLRPAACVVVVVLASAVGAARVYRGMHHPSDVIVGGLMGFTALSIAVLAVRVAAADRDARHFESDDESDRPERRQVPAVST